MSGGIVVPGGNQKYLILLWQTVDFTFPFTGFPYVYLHRMGKKTHHVMLGIIIVVYCFKKSQSGVITQNTAEE